MFLLDLLKGLTSKFNAKKRSYHAFATQFTGTNSEEILGILKHPNIDCEVRPDCIMIRIEYPEKNFRSIDTLFVGWWVVVGENGAVKFYDDETYRIKYEGL